MYTATIGVAVDVLKVSVELCSGLRQCYNMLY